MNTVTEITHLATIDCPQALRDVRAWVVWRFEPNDNPGGKPRKVPYYAGGGRRYGDMGTPEDRRQLVTFDQARTAAARRGMDGVGFAPLADHGVVALDFDDCVDDRGEIHPEVQAILGTTYAELSPSGHGVRAFFRGQLGNRKSHHTRNHQRVHPFGMETFSNNGFVTFTGNVLPLVEILGNEDTVAPVDQPVLDLFARRFSRDLEREATYSAEHQDRVGLTPDQVQAALDALPDDLDYDTWLMVGMALHHETQGEGFDIWDEWSQRSPKYTSREYGWDRWRSFDRGTGPVVTARSLVHLANENGAGIALNGPASPEEFDALVDTPAAEPGETPRFHFEPVSAFSSTQALPWIVKGILPQAGLGVVYGASGAGKSFVVLDMAMSIARGVPWRGKRVRQQRVAYVAAEGADGFRKRVAAYAQHHGVDLGEVPMTVLNAAPNLMEKKDAVDVVKGVRQAGGAGLIIVDTFAQTTPGANENAGEDVGKALAHCKRIHEATGAMVVLIHHAGKDATRGARGWSGLRAAADAEIEVVREGDARALRLTKNKDGEDGLAWGFALEVVNLGADEDLDPITSCVVVDAPLPAVGGVATRRLGPKEQIVNDIIQEMAVAQTTGIEVRAVLDEAVKRMEPPQDGKRDTRRQHAKRALESLCSGDDAPYWLRDDMTIDVM